MPIKKVNESHLTLTRSRKRWKAPQLGLFSFSMLLLLSISLLIQDVKAWGDWNFYGDDCENNGKCFYRSGGTCYPKYNGNWGLSCSAGRYCRPGTCSDSNTCPAGYRCPTNTDFPIVCGEGQYSNAGSSSCSNCPTGRPCQMNSLGATCSGGYFSTISGKWKVCLRCAPGYYCTGGSAIAAASAGRYAIGITSSQTSCSAGNYCPATAFAWQYTCPDYHYSGNNANYCQVTSEGYQRSGTTGQTKCSNGYYAAPGMTNCVSCPAGFKCITPTAVYTACVHGEYQDSATQSTCKTCPAGRYCTQTSNVATCSNGYYSDSGMSQCQLCPPGYYCQSGTKTACPNKQYALGGATSCSTTPNGYNKDDTKKSKGFKCGDGYYSNDSGPFDSGRVCKICPQGYECPDLITPVSCGTGTYCPRGTRYKNQGASEACQPWYNCDINSSIKYDMCGEGQYMTTGKVCTTCPSGMTCHLRYQSNNAGVQAGYYSLPGDNTEFICPAGYDCTNMGAAPVQCADGYFSEEGDLSCTGTSHLCPVNWACPNKEIDYQKQIDCRKMRGMYQDQTGQMECKIAPAGQFIHVDSSGTLGVPARVPTVCPAGTYSFGAARGCHECPPGYKCPSTVKPQMERCLRGTYQLDYARSYCNNCEAGFMCEGDTRIPCPVFKYSLAYQSATDPWGYCVYTNAGYYLASGDNTQQYLCPAGTYSIYASGDSSVGVATCQDCPVGHSCAQAKNPPQACAPGTYQDLTKQTSCKPCGAGTYSLFAEKECHTSPAGYYLQGADRVPRMCKPGTYSSAGASSCTSNSQYSYTPAGASQQYDCEWGFYCNYDGTTQIEVPFSYNDQSSTTLGGYYIPTIANGIGSTGASSSTQCNAGYYCPYGTMKQYPCPAGHYCLAGSSLPTPCAAGSFNTLVMQTSSSACQSCPAQFECNAGAKYPQPCVGTCNPTLMSSSTVVTCAAGTYAGNDNPASAAQCNACWEGHYCPQNLVTDHMFPKPCPKGTYSSSTSATQESDCQDCPAGMVCPYTASRELETGLVCQPGHACGAKTTGFRPAPCPAGQYSDATPFLDLVSNCQTCPNGYVCAEGTNVLYNPMTKAVPGTYAIGGVVTNCPVGTYSTQEGAESSAVCLPCPAGHFCGEGTVDYTANICEAGFYCPEGSSTGQAAACPTGTYSTATGLKSSSECTVCPVGYYCAKDLLGVWQVTACPAGRYSARIMLTVEIDGTNSERGCLECPAGYYCPNSPTFEPIACVPGTLSVAGATACTNCPAGYYCNDVATKSGEQVLIEDGFYYTGPDGLAERPYHISSTYSCPPGYYCAGNVKYACPEGTYQPLYGQKLVGSCLQTPAGYYNEGTANTNFFDTPCPAGMYCPAGTKSKTGYAAADNQVGNAVLCPKGTFRSYTTGTKVEDCGQCPAGYVCSEFTVTPLICAQGYYCPQGSESMQACPTGTFGSGQGLTKKEDCSACFGGRYCQTIAATYISGYCDAMYYCVQNSNTAVPQKKTVGLTSDFEGKIFPVGDECAAGGFCDTGSKFPKPCQAGYYQPSVRKTQASDCVPCPAKKYCSGAPATYTRTDIEADMSPYVPDPLPTGLCYAGYYCTGGAYSPKQFTVQPGHWSLAGADKQEQCPKGTFQHQIAQSSCIPCPETFYCPNLAMTAPIACDKGYYCPKGTIDQTLQKCPVGTYAAWDYFYDVSQCQDCPSGKYCNSLAATAVTGDCNAGHYCISKQTIPNPGGTSGTGGGQCPRYHWCATGVGMGTPNLQGTNDNGIGKTAPPTALVAAGWYSNTVDPTSKYFSTPEMHIYQCSKGYICPTTGSSWSFAATNQCAVGTFCDTGYSAATSCGAGYYQPNPMQDRCFKCPKGYFCTSAVQKDLTGYECPKGYYCPEGTQYSTQYPCPAGRYNDHIGATKIDECVQSPPGYYIPNPATVDVDSTMLCNAGYYCVQGSTSATQNSCLKGYYCPQGSSKPILCTPGKRCTVNNLSAPNADCAAGRYCYQGTDNGTGSQCPKGYFCPQGSDRPTPCPAGTYQPTLGRSALTDCLQCPAKYYCPDAAQTTYSHQCAAGFWCDTGKSGIITGITIGSRSAKENVCSKGKYCTAFVSVESACSALNQVQESTGQTGCYDCPAGHYCTDTTVTKCTPQLEGRSYYCPGGKTNIGTNSDGKFDCPAGTFNFVDGSTTQNDCQPCPSGFYCPTNAVDSATKISACPVGYYCLEGSYQGTICPKGYFCPEGTNMPIPCPRGFYGATTGLSTSACSGLCRAGYYCDLVEDLLAYYTSTYDTSAFPCVNHKVVSVTNHHCISGSLKDNMFLCSAGYYCPAGSIIQIPCPIGTYNPDQGKTTISDCIKCDAGQYCYSIALTGPQAPCQAGYYCPAGSDESTAFGCPAGYYCPSNSPDKTLCAKGTYQRNELQTSCDQCQPGYYCPETGMTNPYICEPGYYCPGYGRQDMLKCPEGSWSSIQGLKLQSECLLCPYGKYCTLQGSNTPPTDPMTTAAQASECRTKSKCYKTSGTPINTFTEADMGNYDAGTTTPYTCVGGEICKANTIVPDYCPPGKYTNPLYDNAPMETEYCISCKVGFYCPAFGIKDSQLQSSSDPYFCYNGYLCLGGAIHPSNLDGSTIKLCPKGSYCPGTTAQPGELAENLCKAQYYNPMEGQTECTACEAGFTCQSTGLTWPDPCPTGHYCPKFNPASAEIIANGGNSQIPCPAGTYSFNKYLKSVSECVPCPPGKYCEVGSTQFTGYCDEGYVCVIGADTPTPSNNFDFKNPPAYVALDNGPCPIGHYCPYGSGYPKKCPAGTYQDETGKADCKDCEPHYYCPWAGLSKSYEVCAPGFYCIKGAIFAQPYDFATGRICGKGKYCIQGAEFDCQPGSYAPVNGLAACYACPPGFYCNAEGGTQIPLECTTGHYCPKGTGDPIPCPLGTYTQGFQIGLESINQCANCTTGYYCDEGKFDRTKKCAAGFYCHSGAIKPDERGRECPTGFYCIEGTKLPRACPQGKYSLPGARSDSNCTDCTEGNYCVRYLTGSIMQPCLKGFYCPDGQEKPIPCPKGTFRETEGAKKLEDCKPCPAGSACDVVGISDYRRKLCPVGYYCEKGSFAPVACPPGTFRPNLGAKEKGERVSYNPTMKNKPAVCFNCVGGFFCPTKATVVPEICPAKFYCLEGSEQPKRCPAGYYCPINTAAPIECPAANYCLAGSDIYIKCPFGTYCPKKSAAPIPCPNGMYGSGKSKNVDIESGCIACGRGLYSEDDPSQCLDCTPGYVCLGRTSAAMPVSKELHEGYKCPKGHYCPLGSYRETPCPRGTYNKYEGSSNPQKCLPCKIDWFTDLPGQPGCKKCGPTSYSDGGATTCTCIGANRDFLKNSGSCLCSIGFKAKNNGPNIDSTEDCEQIVTEVCTDQQETSLLGRCLDKAEQDEECKRQCPGSTGKMVPGTGLCQCDAITDIEEVCGKECQELQPKSSLNAKGEISIKTPIIENSKAKRDSDGKILYEEQTIDPTTLPGYYGTFKCEVIDTSVTDCNMRQMGLDDDGSFSYQFRPNDDLMKASNAKNNDDYLDSKLEENNQLRLKVIKDRTSSSRLLQDSGSKSLKNPAMCIKEGDIMFFNVNAATLSYPAYMKDSILNTNKQFDYSAFLQLEKLINEGVVVTTFSYIFQKAGKYVFQNKGSGTVITISVITAAEQCQGAEDGGVGVAMVTKEKLQSFGIQAQEKTIQPDAVFISLSLLGILSFIFILLTVFIKAKKSMIKGTNLFEQDADVRNSAIYYDKLTESEQKKYRVICCGMFRLKRNKVDSDSSSSGDEKKKGEYAVKYKDLEQLLKDFNKAQGVLNQQLIDREKNRKRTIDEDGNLQENLTQEDEIVHEIGRLFKFVRENRDVLLQNLTMQSDDMLNDETFKKKFAEDLEDEVIKNINNPVTKQVAIALRSLAKRASAKEGNFVDKMQEKTKYLQQKAYEEEVLKNETIKNKIINEQIESFSENILDHERETMIQELRAKLSYINDLAAEEQDHQNHNMQDLLSRRQQKREKLRKIMENLGDRKIKEDAHYQNKLMEIKQLEMEEKKAVDAEIDQLRKNEQRVINVNLQDERRTELQLKEKRMEDFKKKQGKGHDPEGELIFSDMLADYGNKVKALDKKILEDKAKQEEELEEKLKDRKQQRLREIEQHRKEKEALLNAETVKTTSKLTTEMKQIEALLDPIKDEEERMRIILTQQKASSPFNPLKDQEQDQKSYQQELGKKEDQKQVKTILKQIDVENELRRREIEQQKEIIKKQIESCSNDDERQRLMKQLEQYENILTQQLAMQQDEQNRKLKEAIEARRNRRKAQIEKVSREREIKATAQFKNSANSNVKRETAEDSIKNLADRIKAGFNKDEAVQVVENFLDQKHQQESLELMNRLFEQRAKALRSYMVDLMTQKNNELELLKDEYEPQKEFLRNKRVKNLIGLDEFTAALERLTVEETEKQQEIEILFADKEQQIKDDLELLKLQADAEQQKILHDKQHRERVLMFGQLMASMNEGDQMKNYIKKSLQEADRELTQFKLHQDREKAARMKELQEEHEQRLRLLEEQQERLVDVEEMLKKDEAKHVERFRRQREEMLARKLADQQRELLKDMTQKDVDAMLDKHKRDLASMDEVLQEEQSRQLEKMRERMKNRTAAKAKVEVTRQIKLAEIQKQKQHELEQMKLYDQAGGDLATSVVIQRQKEQVNRLVEKAALMQRQCQKQCYSRKIYFKRHIANQQKLNAFLGRGILVDWASSKGGDDDMTAMSMLSLKTEELKEQINEKEEKITYSTLLQHIHHAEETYEQIRKQQ